MLFLLAMPRHTLFAIRHVAMAAADVIERAMPISLPLHDIIYRYAISMPLLPLFRHSAFSLHRCHAAIFSHAVSPPLRLLRYYCRYVCHAAIDATLLLRYARTAMLLIDAILLLPRAIIFIYATPCHAAMLIPLIAKIFLLLLLSILRCRAAVIFRAAATFAAATLC